MAGVAAMDSIFFGRFCLSWSLRPPIAVAMGSILLDYVSELSAACNNRICELHKKSHECNLHMETSFEEEHAVV